MLPADVCRCYGENCSKRDTCARYKQIERDRQAGCERCVYSAKLCYRQGKDYFTAYIEEK